MRNCLCCLIFLLAGYSSPAQQATASGGSSGGSGDLILHWSVGELTLVNTARNGAFVLTQGLLQGKLLVPYNGGGITAGELVIYPNPTTDILQIQTGFPGGGSISLRLYDAAGKFLEAGQAVPTFGLYTMRLGHYASGVYMLHAVYSAASGTERTGFYKIIRLP